MDPATITATAAAIASTIGLLITSLRKRQDTTVEELRLAVRNEKQDHEDTKKELGEEKELVRRLRNDVRQEQNHNIDKDRTIARLRRVLAQNDLDDPTSRSEKSEK
jgi:hypothetical protein